MRYLKPADPEIIREVFEGFGRIVTVEDGALRGGLFSEIAERAAAERYKGRIDAIGIPDKFIRHATQAGQRAGCGLDKDGILDILVNQ